MTTPTPRLGAHELEDFLRELLPEHDTSVFRVEAVEPMCVQLCLTPRAEHIRPGGTLSGPTLMLLADTAMFLAVLAMIGREAQALTTSLNIHFLRRPPPAQLLAEARILQLGRQLAVGEVTIFSEGEAAPVAFATVTYALPTAPEAARGDE